MAIAFWVMSYHRRTFSWRAIWSFLPRSRAGRIGREECRWSRLEQIEGVLLDILRTWITKLYWEWNATQVINKIIRLKSHFTNASAFDVKIKKIVLKQCAINGFTVPICRWIFHLSSATNIESYSYLNNHPSNEWMD